jgi:Tfp pilus assembly protein PilN
VSQVNLLPRELLEKAKTRQLTVLIGIVGAVIAALLIVLWIFMGHNLNNINSQVAQQDALNSSLQAKAAGLSQYSTMATTLTTNRQTLSAASAGRVDWATVLNDVGAQLPDQMWLTALTITTGGAAAPPAGGVAAASPGAVASPAAVPVGTINMSATSTTYLLPIARWVSRLNQATNNWANGWAPGATFSANSTTSRVYTTTASTQLLSSVYLPPIVLGPGL